MVQRDMKIDLTGSIFAFPVWIGVTVLAFTVGVTIVAAIYPSRRRRSLTLSRHSGTTDRSGTPG